MGKRMINYSVYMMRNSLKPNLPEKAYAKAQVKEVMSFRDFVAHIAEHGGYKRGQVKGVLSDMCSCLVEQLLEGKKVMLDERISPIQRPHYFSSSYAYMFLSKKNYYRF